MVGQTPLLMRRADERLISPGSTSLGLPAGFPDHSEAGEASGAAGISRALVFLRSFPAAASPEQVESSKLEQGQKRKRAKGLGEVPHRAFDRMVRGAPGGGGLASIRVRWETIQDAYQGLGTRFQLVT